MKTTLKQLDDRCRRFVNPLMRRTRFGISLRRLHESCISVELVPRQPGCKAVVKFEGSAREVDAFLAGLMAGVALERVDEAGCDGSEY